MIQAKRESRSGLAYFHSIASSLIAPLSAFLSGPILSRGLDVGDRGEVAAASSLYLLLLSGLTLGIPEAVSYFVAKKPEISAKVARRAGIALFCMGAVSAVVITVVLTSSGDKISVSDEFRSSVLISLFALPPALAVAGFRSVAQGLNLWHQVSLERLVTGLTRLVSLAILAVTSSLTVQTAVASIAASSILGGAVYLRNTGRFGTSDEDPPPMWSMVNFGIHVWFGSIFGILLSRLDQVVMIPLAGAEQLGVYAVAVNYSEISLMLVAAISLVTYVEQSGTPDLRAVTRTVRITSSLTLLACLIAAACSPFVIPILFGDVYKSAVLTSNILLLAPILSATGSILGAYATARGFPLARSMLLIVACSVNLLLIVWLVPSLGANGAALATVGGSLAATLGITGFCVRRLQVPLRDLLGLRREDLRTVWLASATFMPDWLRGRAAK